MQTEGVGVDLTLDIGFYDVVDFLVGVVLVGAHVNEHLAAVGNDIVLGASIDNGERHLRGAKKVARFLEFIVSYPNHVVQGFVYGVHTLVSRGVPTLSVSYYVEHHQALFSYGRLHARRLAHYCHVDFWKQRQCAGESVFARHLFFRRSEIHVVVWLRS